MHGFLKRISIRLLSFARIAGWLALMSDGQTISPVIAVDYGPNAPQQISKRYVILVSLDGFRYDYAKRYHAEHLLTLAAEGASAPEGMLPAYSSITFPNHYSIVTGSILNITVSSRTRFMIRLEKRSIAPMMPSQLAIGTVQLRSGCWQSSRACDLLVSSGSAVRTQPVSLAARERGTNLFSRARLNVL
jgi:hypothetical protein